MKSKFDMRIISLLVLIVLIATVLRFTVVLTGIHNFDIKGDANNYLIMSRQLVDDGVYGYSLNQKSNISNAYVTPGYPLFLSLAYSVLHDPYRQVNAVRIFQVLIGGIITPLLAFLFVVRLFKRKDMALLTAFFVSIYPTYFLSTSYILTEVLSLAGMLLYFYLQTIALQERKLYLNILSGAAFAVGVLIRPAMLPLFIVPFAIEYFTGYKKDRLLLLKLFAWNVAAFAAVMSPWWIRNYLTMHRVILLSTGSGDPLLTGSYPYMTNLFKDYLSEKVRVSESDYAKRRIIEGFTTQPLLYFQWYTIGKMRYLFAEPWLYSAAPQGSIFYSAVYSSMSIIHNAFLYLGVVGAVVASFVKRLYIFFNIYALIMLGLLLVFIPVNRYAYQVMFFLMAAVSFLIFHIVDLVRKRYTIAEKKTNA